MLAQLVGKYDHAAARCIHKSHRCNVRIRAEATLCGPSEPLLCATAEESKRCLHYQRPRMKRSINRAAPALPPMPALVSVHRLRLLELLLATRLFASVGVEPVFTENISDAERVAVMGLFGATVTI